MIKFSIIVPVYNTEKYLNKCVDSILAQSYQEYELLLIDDGSSDDSGRICDEYAEKSEKVRAFHKGNTGPSGARNYGLDRVTGDYVVFVDSDDWIEQGSLSAFAEAIGDNRPDVLVTRIIEAFDGEMVYTDENMEEYLKEPLTKERALEWIINVSKHTWPPVNKVLAYSYIQRNNMCFLAGRLQEDMDWVSRICYTAETFSFCSKPWYYYRQKRQGSIMNSIKAKNIIDVIEMAAKHFDYNEQHKTQVSKLVLDRIMASVYMKINEIKKCSEEDKQKVIECIDANKKIFKVAPAVKYKIFVVAMKIVGTKNAIRMMDKING